MKKKYKLTILFLLLIISLLLGYGRDVLFKGVNAVIEGAEVYHSTIPISQFILDLKESVDLSQLKWVMTFLFIGLFGVIHLLATKVFFGIKYVSVLFRLYIASFIFFSLYLIGVLLLNQFNGQYSIIRGVLGFFQSPLPFILSFPIILYLKQD